MFEPGAPVHFVEMKLQQNTKYSENIELSLFKD